MPAPTMSLYGHIMHESAKAIRFRVMSDQRDLFRHGQEAWLPLSQIDIFYAASSGRDVVTIPVWLAEKKARGE